MQEASNPTYRLGYGRYRYGRWDGTQEVPPFDADQIMESLSDDFLADGDLRNALQRIMQRGLQTGRLRVAARASWGWRPGATRSGA